MFDILSTRLKKTIAKINAKTILSEADVLEITHDIKIALLEADVNYLVVKAFISRIKEKVVGADLVGKLNPSQQVVKIVHSELVEILGGDTKPFILKSGINVVMVVGLQGSGKTTTVAKIAKFLQKKGATKPLIVAADVYRPAAVNQLATLGRELKIDVFEKGTKAKPQTIVEEAITYAKENSYDLVIIDTAGRLAIDEPLMRELVELKTIARPNEIWFVSDALAGQDIVNVATKFNEALKMSGIIITKLDSDARGGAALSLRFLLNLPIVFVGVGEKTTALDYFYPDRMADRILGMGDVLTLIEKAEEVIDEKASKRLMNRMISGSFDLNDLIEQLNQMRKLGKMSKVFKMIPGLSSKVDDASLDSAEDKLAIYQVLISSMTKSERKNPKLLKEASRKNRIIKGSGRSAQEFNRLVNDFERMKKQMIEVSKSIKSGSFGSNFNL